MWSELGLGLVQHCAMRILIHKLCYFSNSPLGYSWGPWELAGAHGHHVGDPCSKQCYSCIHLHRILFFYTNNIEEKDNELGPWLGKRGKLGGGIYIRES